MKHFLTAVSIACTGLFYLSIGFATNLSEDKKRVSKIRVAMERIMPAGTCIGHWLHGK